MNPWEQHIYESGREARRLSISKRSCPYGMGRMRERHWWLAGWNDEDIGIGEMEDAA